MARKEGQTVEQGIQLAIQAMLVSPHFLFRIERDPAPNDPARVHKISDLELASRLSLLPLEFDAGRRAARRSPKPTSCARPACSKRR